MKPLTLPRCLAAEASSAAVRFSFFLSPFFSSSLVALAFVLPVKTQFNSTGIGESGSISIPRIASRLLIVTDGYASHSATSSRNAVFLSPRRTNGSRSLPREKAERIVPCPLLKGQVFRGNPKHVDRGYLRSFVPPSSRPSGER